MASFTYTYTQALYLARPATSSSTSRSSSSATSCRVRSLCPARVPKKLWSCWSISSRGGSRWLGSWERQIFQVDRRAKQDKAGQTSALSALTIGMVFDITWIVIGVTSLRICNTNGAKAARMRSFKRYKLHESTWRLPPAFPRLISYPAWATRSWSQLNCSHAQGQDWGIHPFTLILNAPSPPPNNNTYIQG